MADPKDKKTPAAEAPKPADLDSALARITELERERDGLRSERDTLRSERDGLRGERERLTNEHLLARRTERDDFEEQLRGLQTQLREAEAEAQRQTDQATDAQRENARLRESLAAMRGEHPVQALPPEDVPVTLVARRGLRFALRDGSPQRIHAHGTFTATLGEMRDAGFTLGDAFDLGAR